MPSPSIICVENLGKRYVLDHQAHERYTALRDVLANGVKRLARKLSGAGSGSANDPKREEFWALKDVSFDIREGENVGIVGRNGAGKSTLLKLLSRITEPTQGRITLRGRVATLLEVGTGFHPELTGWENIYLNGAVLGMRREEVARRFDEIVAFAEVEKFLDTPVKHYSSGMYMRLAFAVAAHLESEVLLFDEVLSVGDTQFQKKCLGKMGEVGKQGRTVLFVSHNMQAVHTLCNRAILLADGGIVQDGAVTTVVDAYLSSGGPRVMERVWADSATAPRNENVTLHSAKIISDTSSPESIITVATPFRIEFVFTLSLTEALAYVGIQVFSIYGEPVFRTDAVPRVIKRGTYAVSCHVPGNLLNDGTYKILFLVARDNSVLLFLENEVLIVEIQDIERPHGSWLGEMPGAVRPKLNWAFDSGPSQTLANRC